MSNRVALMKEAVATAIAKAKDRHRIKKESFKRSMMVKCRERVQ